MSGFPRRLFGVGVLVTSVLLVSVSGCADATGNVSGEVKIKDKLVEEGLVTFLSQVRRKKVVAGPIKHGKYEVTGLPVGEAIVTVQITEKPKGGTGGKGLIAPPKTGAKTPTGLARYADAKTSGLKHTVTQGENTYNIPLEP
jgi:hypothetical protein